jgi:hypothetical protein
MADIIILAITVFQIWKFEPSVPVLKVTIAAIDASGKSTSFPGSFLLWSKDPGGRWSRDLLKSSRFLISVVLPIWEGWECSS